MIKSIFNNSGSLLSLPRCSRSSDAIYEAGPIAEQQRLRAEKQFLSSHHGQAFTSESEKENEPPALDELIEEDAIVRMTQEKDGSFTHLLKRKCIPLSQRKALDGNKIRVSKLGSHIRSHSDLSGNNTTMTRSNLMIPTLIVTPPSPPEQLNPVAPQNLLTAAAQALEQALHNSIYNKATELIRAAILCGSKNALKDLLEQKGINLLAFTINALKEQSYYKAVGSINCLSLLDQKEALLAAIKQESINVNAKDSSGKVLLHYAAIQERYEALAVLQELGANTTALIIPALKSLLNKSYGEAIKLIEAIIALGKKTTLYGVIKQAGINVNNTQSTDGWTPLHEAAFSGYLETIKLFVELGANIDPIAGKVLWTPLYHSVIGSHSKATETLLDLGASPHAQDTMEDTPLHYAAKQSTPEIVRLLVDKQARLNAPDLQGYTPLHLAAQNGKIEVLELLIQLGADMDLIDKNGKTALDLAQENNHIEAIQLLQAPMEKTTSLRA